MKLENLIRTILLLVIISPFALYSQSTDENLH